MKRIFTQFALLAALALFSFSCAKPPPPRPAPERMLEHTVMFQGETLGLIAKWYTGSAANWNAILEANPGLDVHRLKRGTIISVPDRMVVTEKPLPKSFIEKFYGMKQQNPSGSAGDLGAGQGADASGLRPLHEDAESGSQPGTEGGTGVLPPEKALPEAASQAVPDEFIADDEAPGAQDNSGGLPSANEAQAPSADSQGQAVKSRDELLQELLAEGDEANQPVLGPQ